MLTKGKTTQKKTRKKKYNNNRRKLAVAIKLLK